MLRHCTGQGPQGPWEGNPRAVGQELTAGVHFTAPSREQDIWEAAGAALAKGIWHVLGDWARWRPGRAVGPHVGIRISPGERNQSHTQLRRVMVILVSSGLWQLICYWVLPFPLPISLWKHRWSLMNTICQIWSLHVSGLMSFSILHENVAGLCFMQIESGDI